MVDQPLSGYVVVVAGASRGVGQGIAVELGAAGAFVYALGRTLEPDSARPGASLSETIALIESLGGRGAAISCDCADGGAVAEVFKRVQEERGRLDVLVNSVYVAQRIGDNMDKKFWETPLSFWDEVVDLNLRATFACSYYAAPLLIETAKRDHRTTLIVNVSGRGALNYRYNAAYGIGKSAIERMTKDMAVDLREHDVAVVSIWPNGHATETKRFNGRAAAALAADPKVMARSGQHFWSAEIGRDHGLTDEFGNVPPVGALIDSYTRV
jgi:NAD(P)-dependent dehydrogenase (short-subunit alcohol dehydrogenase family)